jgi:hypothetical protein
VAFPTWLYLTSVFIAHLHTYMYLANRTLFVSFLFDFKQFV